MEAWRIMTRMMLRMLMLMPMPMPMRVLQGEDCFVGLFQR
jgi:hypothetical protein